MKTMSEYIEAAYRFLDEVWADAVELNIRENLKVCFPDWTPEEQKEIC